MSDRPTPSHLPDGDPTVDRASLGATATPQQLTHAPDGTVRSGLESFAPAAESRYVFCDELARGGMGIVYRATDKVFGREVAVKVLQEKFGLMSAAARRFADEARITGQLQHPAIPPVHDLGVLPDRRPFLAMKLIKGDTLDAILNARPDPAHDRGRCVAAFEQVCQALAYAHAHNVIHRDLKPANIMLGSFGEVQVMDWGLAKVLGTRTEEADPGATTGGTEIRSLRDSDGQATQAGAILGTPAFMPPEQAVGAVSKIDTRSDVFGLGAILAVILTGKPPYSGADGESTRVLAARGKVETCYAQLDASGADPGLVALCKRCLSPEPEDRPANAEEVARAVAALRAESEERARRAELDRVRVEGEQAAAELKAVEQRKRRRVLAGAAVVIMIGLAAFAGAQRRNSNRLAAEQEQTQKAKELAEARLGQITDTWYNQVIFVQNELDQQAVSPKFRLGLLETARDRLAEVLRDQPRTAHTDHMLHVVYRRLAATQRETGDMAGALANWAEADRIARTRFAEEPTDTHAWRDVADAEIGLGDIRLEQGDYSAALVVFQDAERRLDALIAASPKSRARDKAEEDRAKVGARIGMILLYQGKPAEGRAAVEAGLRVGRRIAAERPSDPEVPFLLTWVLQSAADSAREAGDYAGAEAYLLEAKELTERQLRADTRNQRFAQDQQSIFFKLGDLEVARNRPDQARKWFEQTIELRLEHAHRPDALPDALHDVAVVYERLGDLSYKAKDYPRAVVEHGACLRYQEQLVLRKPVPNVRRNLSNALLRLGGAQLYSHDAPAARRNLARCRAIREELAAVENPDPVDLYAVAEVHYLLGNLECHESVLDFAVAEMHYLRAESLLLDLQRRGHMQRHPTWADTLTNATNTARFCNSVRAVVADVTKVEGLSPLPAATRLIARARVLAKRGDAAGAVEAAEMIRALKPMNGQYVATTARGYAVATAAATGAERERYAREAVALLDRAVELGHKTARNDLNLPEYAAVRECLAPRIPPAVE